MITKVNEVDTQCYILSSVYISPWCKSLLIENSSIIQGYMLDATWKMMSFYVTSILMGICFNIGIPLSFSIGHSENKNIYLELLRTFEKQVQVDLHCQIIISYQETALKAAISKFEMINLAYLEVNVCNPEENVDALSEIDFNKKICEGTDTQIQSL